MIFLSKKDKKSDKKKNDKKQIIDLTSYISPDMINSDVDGSYTGIPSDTYYYDEPETPVQDADDL